MTIRNLIKEPYNRIFNCLYDITEGKVILSGSLGLKLQNIIKREVNDLDVNIFASDWEVYGSEIGKLFRVHPSIEVRYGILEYDVYNCFDKQTKLENFHLFVNYGKDVYITINDIRVLNPKIHLIDKEMIAKSGQDVDKHEEDIVLLKKHLNEK
jgi:hypothetical protein